MSTVDLFGAQWMKSSYSTSGEGSNCVEVAFVAPAIAVRDSKSPSGGALLLPVESWTGLLASASDWT
jgi:hypothetical protein